MDSPQDGLYQHHPVPHVLTVTFHEVMMNGKEAG